ELTTSSTWTAAVGTRSRGDEARIGGASSLPPETPSGVWTLRWAGGISNGTLVPCHARRMSVRRTFSGGMFRVVEGTGSLPAPRRRPHGASGDRVAQSDAPQVTAPR